MEGSPPSACSVLIDSRFSVRRAVFPSLVYRSPRARGFRTAALLVEIPVEVTENIMPGVVSIPHGWGHDDPASALHVAAAHAGANSNLLADDTVDPLSGNAVLNGIPVSVEPIAAP